MKTIPCNYLIIQGRIVSSDAEGGVCSLSKKQRPPYGTFC